MRMMRALLAVLSVLLFAASAFYLICIWPG
jgi:hypothetical protein